MKVTVLGCGAAGGVPLIGNDWGACDPHNVRNRRLRVSVLIEHLDTTLLIDTSPDMRAQFLAYNINQLSAVIYTHEHADHSHGIDELRSVNWMLKKPIDIYASTDTMESLQKRFAYIFDRHRSKPFTSPSIIPHIINGPFKIGALDIVPFNQDHGSSQSLGFRINSFAYSTDVKNLDENAFLVLEGVKVWLVDTIREEPHPSHSHLEQTLAWIQRVKPERAWLTHMNETLDYEKTAAKLPLGVWPAHDGLVIQC